MRPAVLFGVGIPLTLIIAVIVVLIFYLYRYYNSGWTDFKFTAANKTVCWTVPKDDERDVTRLQFQNAVFTVQYKGATYTQIVSSTLNNMAQSAPTTLGTGSAMVQNKQLCLDFPLNVYSFPMKSFVPSSTVDYRSAICTLSGQYRVF